jgi:hypothetical protein
MQAQFAQIQAQLAQIQAQLGLADETETARGEP